MRTEPSRRGCDFMGQNACWVRGTVQRPMISWSPEARRPLAGSGSLMPLAPMSCNSLASSGMDFPYPYPAFRPGFPVHQKPHSRTDPSGGPKQSQHCHPGQLHPASNPVAPPTAAASRHGPVKLAVCRSWDGTASPCRTMTLMSPLL